MAYDKLLVRTPESYLVYVFCIATDMATYRWAISLNILFVLEGLLRLGAKKN